MVWRLMSRRTRPFVFGHGCATLLLLFAMVAPGALAQAPAAEVTAAPPVSEEDLQKLVGPIALYPDDLIAIILPASTNPVQVVQADRFLDKRKSQPSLPVDAKWDDAVKSLLNYPEVIKKMSVDLDWTTDLGEAVVADQGAVLDAIQVFRRQSQSAGNLKSDDKQVVIVEKEVVKIVPANPQVIYVPQYNPATVVVYSATPVWGYYPAPYPVYYYPYPPGAAFASGLIWGAAIGAAWNGGHWNTNWGGNNNITINRNTNINTGNINTGNINRSGANQLPAGTTAWKSNKQPGQVSGGARAQPVSRTGDAATSRANTPRASTQTPRATPQPTRTGAAQGNVPARSGAAANRDAFSNYGSGRQTQMDSARGSASRGGMSNARPAPAARGGGGGRVGRGG